MPRIVRLGFGRSTIEREVDDELAFHIEMRTQRLVAQGLTLDDARREALRQFGNVAQVRDSCVSHDRQRVRVLKRMDLMDDLRQDVAYAGRMLRRNLGVTVVVVLTLALGIGANASIFTLVNAVLLRQLPVRAPDELVAIGDPARVTSMSFSSSPIGDMFSYPTYRELRGERGLASGILASARADRLDIFLNDTVGEPSRARGRLVSGNYFNVLGVPAHLGRTFDGTEDDRVGGAPVVTVSHAYWMQRLNGDSSAVGKDIRINGARYTIIGVTPPWFTGEVVGMNADLWLPLAMQGVLYPTLKLLDDASAYWLLFLARRAPGETLEQMQGAFPTRIKRILSTQARASSSGASVEELEIQVTDGSKGLSRIRRSYQGPLLVLMVGVGLLLLMICVNVASLLLARAVARTREMSVRLALGARRGRLVRQLLTESAMLAAAGAALGLYLAKWGSHLLLVLAADGTSAIPIDTSIDLRVLAFTIGLVLLSVAFFGLVPALRASGIDLAATMRASAKSVTGSALGSRQQRIPVGKALITAQVALSLVLLMGAALLVRSLRRVESVTTGLDRDHLVIVEVDANARGHVGDQRRAVVRDLAERFQRVPGVTSVSFSGNGIFSGTEGSTNVGIPGFVGREEEDTVANNDEIGPGYVAATGARLVRGREFLSSDGVDAPRVVILNESFARFYFGTSDPVGRTIRVGDSAQVAVVGVVADIKDRTLVGAPVRRYYVPYLQETLGAPGALRYIVRTKGDPSRVVSPIRQAIVAFDPQLPIDGIDVLSTLMRASVREERLLARLASGFGAMALLLAAIGLYGVMTYAITRRTSEIGLRVALGATRRTVVGMVLGDALRMVVAGTVVGVPLALLSLRLLEDQLHGVGATDPIAITVALVVLVGSGFVAALLPALRASRVPPLEALREE